MRPLKVTAVMTDGAKIAGDIPVLDAILEWRRSLILGEKLGLHHRLGENRTPYTPGLIPIPIVRRRVSGFEWPVPCCSWPIFHAKADNHAHYVRQFRVEPDLIRPDARRVFSTTNGEFKSYRLPLRTRLVDRVVWFCLARDARGVKEIRQLLRDVTHLGKKTSQGYGRVTEWLVEDVEHDWSWFAPSDDGPVLMRTLPASRLLPANLLGAQQWFGGTVPPYWCSQYFTEAVRPC